MTAKESALLAALRITQGDPHLAAAVTREAELAVLRRLVAGRLRGGEETYWTMIKEELTT